MPFYGAPQTFECPYAAFLREYKIEPYLPYLESDFSWAINSLPNTNCAPFDENDKNFETWRPTKSNATNPQWVLSTISATMNWRAKPHRTGRQTILCGAAEKIIDITMYKMIPAFMVSELNRPDLVTKLFNYAKDKSFLGFKFLIMVFETFLNQVNFLIS